MTDKPKVFVSVGMRGRSTDDVLKDIAEVGLKAREFSELAEIVHNYNCPQPTGNKSSKTYYLGEAIKLLGECDVCIFAKVWKKYASCAIEHHDYEIYGIQIIYM